MDKGDELIACVKLEDGKVKIYPLSREEAHEADVPHIVVRVLGFSRDGLLLVQKRSKLKRSNPGRYTDTASGHVAPSEAASAEGLFLAAERELFEEMGVHGKLSFFTGPVYDEGDSEINYVFIALVEGAPGFSDEVDAAGSGFKTPEELRAMLDTEDFVPLAREMWSQFLELYPTSEDVKKLAMNFKDREGLEKLAEKLDEGLRLLLSRKKIPRGV
ncbi:MAG: NUDIX domain-containing protein [Candidatus Jordarchaeales archaeon]